MVAPSGRVCAPRSSTEVSSTVSGVNQGGKPEGFSVISDSDGSRSEGPYLDGEQHGVWTYFDEKGRELGTITYEHGRRAGG